VTLISGSFHAGIERPKTTTTTSALLWYVSRCTIVSHASASSHGESLFHERRNPTEPGGFLGWPQCNAGCKRPSSSLHSRAPIAQMVAARPAGPFPNHTTTEHVLQSQPGLRLLQLEEWEEGHLYNENPSSSIHYAVKWKVTHSEKNKRNKKVVSRDTEQDIVLAPAAYWTQILQPSVCLERR
jgi:hypothetical protein